MLSVEEYHGYVMVFWTMSSSKNPDDLDGGGPGSSTSGIGSQFARSYQSGNPSVTVGSTSTTPKGALLRFVALCVLVDPDPGLGSCNGDIHPWSVNAVKMVIIVVRSSVHVERANRLPGRLE
jgi:hypothetical protein